jgi:chromosome segregation ATPase
MSLQVQSQQIVRGMNLAQRDKLYIELKKKIQCKENMLLERYSDIKTASNENALLKAVLEDYANYYQDALETQRKQEEALLLLRDYLEEISKTVDNSNEKMEYLQNERSSIVNKLENVRHKMKDLSEKAKNALPKQRV